MTTTDRAELALSLDVIYHLVEDTVYESYMGQLFDSATKYVIVYLEQQCEVVVESARPAP